MADKIIFTGKIDEFYDYRNTPLEYRAVKWDTKILDKENYQRTPVFHYPNLDIPYIRVIEHKHFEPHNKEIQEKKKTVVSYEYDDYWNEDKEALYPIYDQRNSNVFLLYRDLADNEKKIIFKGRLGKYKYYSMANVIEDVMNEFAQ